MNLSRFLYGILLVTCFLSCNQEKGNKMADQKQIEEQLSKINSLLRDSAFAVSIAKGQDSAYYVSQNKEVPEFSHIGEDVVKKKFRDEKIATNLAGFYALESGIGVLVEQKGQTPVYWLNKIVSKQLDSPEVLILNRFANAAWKAGQPFRSLSRIKRENFIGANMLSAEETQKDYDQVSAAATKLLDSLKALSDQPTEIQFKKIDALMKDTAYAFEMAKHMEASYYIALKKPAPEFISAAEDSMIIEKNSLEEKIATNIAGFYALECGVNYLTTTQHKLPSEILQSIIDGSIDVKDKNLLERFANVTWKAGQPFRSLDRIKRDVFTPFFFLPKEEIDKDWVQITTVAKLLIKML